jgi:hypothetical protein
LDNNNFEPQNIYQLHGETSLTSSTTLLPDKFQKWIADRKKSKRNPDWIKSADFDIERPSQFHTPDYSKYQHLSVIEIFEKLIDDEIIMYLVEETKNYALFLNFSDPNITGDEIRCF